MNDDYYSAVFPIESIAEHVRRDDLKAFKGIGLDRINGGSHLAQLRRGIRTVGLCSLQVYPQHQEIHLTFIEICADVRGDRLGRRLLTSVFEHAAEMSQQIGKHTFVTVGGFTPKGKRSILPAMRELSVQYSAKGVTFDCPSQYRS